MLKSISSSVCLLQQDLKQKKKELTPFLLGHLEDDEIRGEKSLEKGFLSIFLNTKGLF